MVKRIQLSQEPIADADAVTQYDKGAKYYMLPEYKYFVKKILGKGIKEGRVLDIGTGSGLLALELAKAKGCNFDITAIDISHNMIRKACENARQTKGGNNIKFLVSTAAAIPFADNSFDLVISYASLHHWFNPVTVFNEIERVTGKTGCIIVRDNKRVYQNPFLTTVVKGMCLFMNKRHRENWPKALLASYTIPEIMDIVSKSQLRDCRVTSDFVFIDLSIETI
jgi:ubiquinone/menaquinone biosynthesis C-methylase UbiE